MGAPHPEAPVVFDWTGTLALARQCVSLASQVAFYQTARAQYARTALDEWTGVFAGEFAQRMGVANATAGELESALRYTATLYAAAWQHAATQNQYNLWAEHCQALDNKRSDAQKAWDWFFGDSTKFPPQPPPAPMPEGPDFSVGGYNPQVYPQP